MGSLHIELQSIDRNLLDGIWTKNIDENSLFEIKGDSIIYMDVSKTCYVYTKSDTIFIDYRDWVFKGVIKKLTIDELIIVDIEDNDVLNLIKIR